jgi:Ethanolamine utilization protein EutJ (predicted chaperonin)
MKRVISNDRAVRRLAKKLGAWSAIAEAIAIGQSGVVGAGTGLWTIGYFQDGLVAIEAHNPIEQAEIALMMASRLTGRLSCSLGEPSWPVLH